MIKANQRKGHPAKGWPLNLPLQAALVASWGIFGAAAQWGRDRQNRTPGTMVHRVLGVAAAALAPVLG